MVDEELDEEEEMTYEELLEYLNNSTYRLKVLKSLLDDPKMPKDISDDCGILQNHISNVLSILKGFDLVVCINPEVKKGRIYRLTEYGEKVCSDLF